MRYCPAERRDSTVETYKQSTPAEKRLCWWRRYAKGRARAKGGRAYEEWSRSTSEVIWKAVFHFPNEPTFTWERSPLVAIHSLSPETNSSRLVMAATGMTNHQVGILTRRLIRATVTESFMWERDSERERDKREEERTGWPYRLQGR
jgi:hypothetical protein